MQQGGDDEGPGDRGDLQDLSKPAPHGPDDEEKEQDAEDDAVEWVQADFLAIGRGSGRYGIRKHDSRGVIYSLSSPPVFCEPGDTGRSLKKYIRKAPESTRHNWSYP